MTSPALDLDAPARPRREARFAEFGAMWFGIVAGVGIAIVRTSNGEDYDRAVLPTLAFGVLVAMPGLLALMARWDRPGLYLASGLAYLPMSLLSIVTLPLMFVAAMAFVAYGRHADEKAPIVWPPITALGTFILAIAGFAAMLFGGGDDPRCSSTPTSTSCTSDVITNREALAGLAIAALALGAAWLLARPRRARTERPAG